MRPSRKVKCCPSNPVDQHTESAQTDALFGSAGAEAPDSASRPEVTSPATQVWVYGEGDRAEIEGEEIEGHDTGLHPIGETA